MRSKLTFDGGPIINRLGHVITSERDDIAATDGRKGTGGNQR